MPQASPRASGTRMPNTQVKLRSITHPLTGLPPSLEEREMKCKLTVPMSLTVIARARVRGAELTADPGPAMGIEIFQ
jgi:hypothetical protein